MEVLLDCLKIGCHKCCEETEMQLSKADVKRIEKLGFKVDDFSEVKDGVRVLRNVDGKCFFLKEGKCSIYDSRPLGCKLYPVVWDVERRKAVVHDFCPLASSISKVTLKRAERVLRKHIQSIFGEL